MDSRLPGAVTSARLFRLAGDHGEVGRSSCYWQPQAAAGQRALCLPPYGANIASAGLALGVFVAPRQKKLVAVRGGQQFAFSQLLQEGMFKGKFIDLAALHGVDLISLGEESSEWEKLFDEWDRAESHVERCNYWARAIELKKRIPVPPLYAYREELLHGAARASFGALKKAEKDENEALDKVEHGLRMADAAKIAWGAADLLRLQEQMAAEPLAWTAAQINAIQPHFDRAKQAVIMHFNDWLSRQAPRSEALDVVGDFKHKMLTVIGGDIKHIGLEEQFAALEARTAELIRHATVIADARQLVRDVESLLNRASNPAHITRLAELRALREQGKGYAAKLAGMSERVSLPEIGAARAQLSALLAKLKEAEDEVAKRGKQIWKKQLRSIDDIDQLLIDVESLINAYENLPDDQQDFLLMRRALRIYEKDFQQLANERLSWPEFKKLLEQAKTDALNALGEEELPWPPEETIGEFAAVVAKRRNAESARWIEALEAKVAGAAAMAAFDANRLLGDAARPPAYLTEPHEKRREQAARRLEARLDEIKIDWLVEKFNELPGALQERFIKWVSGGR